MAPLDPSSRMLMTGGTGFVGRSLLRWLADPLHGLDSLRPTIVSRAPARFAHQYPDLAARADFIEGDVRTFAFPDAAYTHVVHGALDANAVARAHPEHLRTEVLEGTRHVLNCASAVGATHFLFLSSGAAYGRQPPDLEQVPEDYVGGLDPSAPSSAYGLAKLEAEALCAAWCTGVRSASSARLFAFVGVDLPLDQHFAIGNFIRDALAGRPVEVKGDGSPLRTYLDATDLSEWLVHLVARGAAGRVYNVGSDEAVDMAALARTVADVVSPGLEVHIANARADFAGRHRYVPSIARAKAELGLSVRVPLVEAIRRTAAWHRR